MTSDPVAHYGFTAVPRDPDVLFSDHPTAGVKKDELTVDDFPLPDSALVQLVKIFVKVSNSFEYQAAILLTTCQRELDEHTYNHSHRVYVYGAPIYAVQILSCSKKTFQGVALTQTHFPQWSYDKETYYLACLLHDIGTAAKFLASTKMSFEFKGAIVARDLILQMGGVEDQADSVCDAIIRHQDIFVKGCVVVGLGLKTIKLRVHSGNITMIGQILQLATIIGT